MTSDDFVQQFFGVPRTREVLEWLAESKVSDIRSIGEQDSNEESIALANQIYDAGAREVLAVEIEDVGNGQNTCKMVITLPRRKSERERVFAWVGKLAESQGFSPDVNNGQSYLFVMLD